MSKKTDVAELEQKSVVPAINYGEDAGAGMEQADAASFAIPFLAVVQKLSPVCDESSGDYNPDAKPGMLRNTVTGELYDGKEGIVVLPCHYQRRFLRWAPRDSGGGFKGEMMPEDAAELELAGTVKNQDGRLYFPLQDGTINEKKCDRLSDVRNHFCVIEGGGNVLLSLGSTQIKKSKNLNSMLSAIVIPGTEKTMPTFANRVRIQTVLEQNDQGNWYGVKFTIEGLSGEADYLRGKAFWQSLKQGTAGKVHYQDETAEAAGSNSDKF